VELGQLRSKMAIVARPERDISSCNKVGYTLKKLLALLIQAGMADTTNGTFQDDLSQDTAS
jgi:hypothetical protein